MSVSHRLDSHLGERISRRAMIPLGLAASLVRPLRGADPPISSYRLKGASPDEPIQYVTARSGKLVYTTHNRLSGVQTLWYSTTAGQLQWSKSTSPDEHWGKPGLSSSDEVILYARRRPELASIIKVFAPSDGAITKTISDPAAPSDLHTFVDNKVISVRPEGYVHTASLGHSSLDWRRVASKMGSDIQCRELISDGLNRALQMDLCTARGWIFDVADNTTRYVNLNSPHLQKAVAQIRAFRAEGVVRGVPEERQARTVLLSAVTLARGGSIWACVAPYDPTIGLINEVFDVYGTHVRSFIWEIPAGVRLVPIQLTEDGSRFVAVFPFGDVVVYPK